MTEQSDPNLAASADAPSEALPIPIVPPPPVVTPRQVLPLGYRPPLEDVRPRPRLSHALGMLAGFIYAGGVSFGIGYLVVQRSPDSFFRAVEVVVAILTLSMVAAFWFRQSRGFGIGILIMCGCILLVLGTCFMILSRL